jgi:Carboxypeptidase regulatory-like domain
MKRRLSAAVVAGLFMLTISSSAFGAEIVGTVADLQGKPVKGVQLKVQNSTGKSIASVTPDSKGYYQITGLKEGKYNYILEPHTAGFKGGQLSEYLSNKGLTIDWKVSSVGPAAAVASAGIGTAASGATLGLSSAAFGAAVAGGSIAAVTGGVVGGYAAAGGFSSSQASPSL